MPDNSNPTDLTNTPTVMDTVFNLQAGAQAFEETPYARLKFLSGYNKPTPIEGMQFSPGQLRKIIRSV